MIWRQQSLNPLECRAVEFEGTFGGSKKSTECSEDLLREEAIIISYRTQSEGHCA